MAGSIGLIVLLSAAVWARVPASAQELPQRVRFTVTDSGAEQRLVGDLVAVTADTLYVRVLRADSVVGFPRGSVRSLERSRPALRRGRAAGVGCLAVGGALGALGLFGTHDPDSPGLEKAIGAVGFVVGCGVGALGGLVVSSVSRDTWVPWSPS